jgi:hypothetical protein
MVSMAVVAPSFTDIGLGGAVLSRSWRTLHALDPGQATECEASAGHLLTGCA